MPLSIPLLKKGWAAERFYADSRGRRERFYKAARGRRKPTRAALRAAKVVLATPCAIEPARLRRVRSYLYCNPRLPIRQYLRQNAHFYGYTKRPQNTKYRFFDTRLTSPARTHPQIPPYGNTKRVRAPAPLPATERGAAREHPAGRGGAERGKYCKESAVGLPCKAAAASDLSRPAAERGADSVPKQTRKKPRRRGTGRTVGNARPGNKAAARRSTARSPPLLPQSAGAQTRRAGAYT